MKNIQNSIKTSRNKVFNQYTRIDEVGVKMEAVRLTYNYYIAKLIKQNPMISSIQIISYEQQLRQEQRKLEKWSGQQPISNITQRIFISKGKKKQKIRSTIRIYWTIQQKNDYLSFILQNFDTLKKPQRQRKHFKINKMMSQALKTRNRRQCHSHHQKMLKKYNTLQNLVENLRVSVGFEDQTLVSSSQVPIIEKKTEICELQLAHPKQRADTYWQQFDISLCLNLQRNPDRQLSPYYDEY